MEDPWRCSDWLTWQNQVNHYGRNALPRLFKPKDIFLVCQREFETATEVELWLFCSFRFYFLLSIDFCVFVSCLHMTKSYSSLVTVMILFLLSDYFGIYIGWVMTALLCLVRNRESCLFRFFVCLFGNIKSIRNFVPNMKVFNYLHLWVFMFKCLLLTCGGSCRSEAINSPFICVSVNWKTFISFSCGYEIVSYLWRVIIN